MRAARRLERFRAAAGASARNAVTARKATDSAPSRRETMAGCPRPSGFQRERVDHEDVLTAHLDERTDLVLTILAARSWCAPRIKPRCCAMRFL